MTAEIDTLMLGLVLCILDF